MKKINYREWQVPHFEVVEFQKKRTRYCICIPVINEGKKIKKQLVRMKKYSKLADILILDGGSTDKSTDPKFLREQNIRALITSAKGQAVQLRAGFSFALKEGYRGIITIDGNGKDGVSALPRFIKSLNDGFDYTQGSRFIKGGKHKNTPLERHIGAKFFISPVLSLGAKHWYTDTTNGFRAYSQRYLLHPKVKPFRNIFKNYDLLFYLVVRAKPLGLKTKEIPVTRSYPKDKIPTKITGFRNILDLIITAFKAAFGHYNP